MPAPGSHGPFDTRLVQEFPEDGIVFEPEGLGIPQKEAAHVVLSRFFGALRSLLGNFAGKLF